jgi:hypothetical protein
LTNERYIDKPPPCTLFYLSSCKHGPDCKYAHDYILEAEHYEEMRLNAKKAPCPALNKGQRVIVSPHFLHPIIVHLQENLAPGETNASTDTFAHLGPNATFTSKEGVSLLEASPVPMCQRDVISLVPQPICMVSLKLFITLDMIVRCEYDCVYYETHAINICL